MISTKETCLFNRSVNEFTSEDLFYKNMSANGDRRINHFSLSNRKKIGYALAQLLTTKDIPAFNYELSLLDTKLYDSILPDDPTGNLF